MMFSGLARVEEAYSLNSVLKSIRDIGSKGAMLADVSNLVPLDAPKETYLRYAPKRREPSLSQTAPC
jgi:hypothetical protein